MNMTVYYIVAQYSIDDQCGQCCFHYMCNAPIDTCFAHIMNIISNTTKIPIAILETCEFDCVIELFKS